MKRKREEAESGEKEIGNKHKVMKRTQMEGENVMGMLREIMEEVSKLKKEMKEQRKELRKGVRKMKKKIKRKEENWGKKGEEVK